MARNFASGVTNYLVGSGSMNGVTTGCVAFWMKTSSATAQIMPIGCLTGSSRSGLGITLSSVTPNKLTVFAYDATTQRVVATTTASVNTGSWVHIAFNFNTANGSTQQVYVNGALDGSTTASAVWAFTASSAFAFGGFSGGFFQSMNGDMAEVALWDRNLTADEVVALSKGFAANHVALENLVRYHPLARDTVDRVLTGSVASNGTNSVADHPRVMGGLT